MYHQGRCYNYDGILTDIDALHPGPVPTMTQAASKITGIVIPGDFTSIYEEQTKTSYTLSNIYHKSRVKPRAKATAFSSDRQIHQDSKIAP
jgi:hypothetical protein